MTNEEALELLKDTNLILRCSFTGDIRIVEAIDMAIKALGKDTNVPTWIPVSERMPESADCPMDCLVTRKSENIGNYTDMAVAEKDGTWTHEDWEAIVLGDNVCGKKTVLLNTYGDEIVAWMPLPAPWKENGAIHSGLYER